MIRNIETIEEIVCNRCGSSCMEPALPDGRRIARGMIGVFLEGGYFNTFPPDLQRWRVDLCEPCLGWLVSTFVHFPFVSQRLMCDCGQAAMLPFDSTEKLLLHGETAGVPDWMLERYALAMARGAERVQGVDERLRETAYAASKEIETQRTKNRDDCHAMHDALDEIGCPGSGTPLERVQMLRAGPIDERLLPTLREVIRLLTEPQGFRPYVAYHGFDWALHADIDKIEDHGHYETLADTLRAAGVAENLCKIVGEAEESLRRERALETKE